MREICQPAKEIAKRYLDIPEINRAFRSKACAVVIGAGIAVTLVDGFLGFNAEENGNYDDAVYRSWHVASTAAVTAGIELVRRRAQRVYNVVISSQQPGLEDGQGTILPVDQTALIPQQELHLL